MEGKLRILESFMRQNTSIKSLFGGTSKPDDDIDINLIPLLSPIANSVVVRCSRILGVLAEELQHSFETEIPDKFKQRSSYARNFVEYCSYKALNVATQRPDHLADKKFRRLTFDMMLSWEVPGIESESPYKESTRNNSEIEDEDGGSLFYSDSINMAVQVDDKNTVGREAFVRIAPACPTIADIVTVHNLFGALMSSSDCCLHFLIYDKYLASLDKVIKSAKISSTQALVSNLLLSREEIILDVDGTVPTQPVLQHIGISAWPGRLTLTNRVLYFESFGVGSYDKAVVYDLAMDLKQVIKPELTGPLGARLFDNAMMYNSTSVELPVYFEFPEFKGHSRRDYWLAICCEVFYVHKFIRKFNLKEIRQAEALSKAALGVFRYRAVREAFHIRPSQFKTLLPFDLAEKLPRGDMILETLASRLELVTTQRHDAAVGTKMNGKQQAILSPFSSLTLTKLGFTFQETDVAEEAEFRVGDVDVGEINPLEMVVTQSKFDSSKAEAAQATVDQVKVEGIDTNLAVMKELLFPFVELVRCLYSLASWEDPFKSTIFLVLISYAIYRGWIKYVIPCILVFIATMMIWYKHRNKGKPLEPFKVTTPSNRHAVEQLIVLQDAISQFETLFQAGNIILLKLRALLFAALPQATDKVAFSLVIGAAVLAFMHLKYLILLVFLESFTREMPLRKESSDRLIRRLREWWVRIPAAPVQLIKYDDSRKKKDKKKNN